MAVDLPLFPLHSVLFPGGQLRLRVFEPRYIDLVRRCTRDQACFGVCLLLGEDQGDDEAGHERDDRRAAGRGAGAAGAPATCLPAAWGTRARITDFFSTDEGLLGIAATGEGRFRVARTRVRDNGLIVAEVELHDDPPPQPLRAEHCLLAQLLERLHERVGGAHARSGRHRYDDAAWVGYRLAELLPFSSSQRQGMLQCDDPHARLARIATLLPQFQRD